MKSRTQTSILAAAITGLLAGLVFADAPRTAGTISKVTVYRGQALVTRAISIDLPPGTSELIVENLPARIVPESLYAQTVGDVKVLSVRYREQAVKEDTREEVKQIDAQIEDLKNKQYHAKSEQENINDLRSKFRDLWKLSVDAANVDLNRSVMQSEQIESFTQYLEEKSIEWHEKTLELGDLQANLQKELELLQRKRLELAGSSSRAEREAVLFLSSQSKSDPASRQPRKAIIELSYLVDGANWVPQYNLRADPDKSNALIEYHAVVNQTSGEDWNGIALSLSTAEPTMVAAAPILEPMLVSLSASAPAQQAGQQPLLGAEQARQYLMSRKANVKKGVAANVELNELAIQSQAFVFSVGRKEVEEFQRQIAEVSRIEGISVTYDLPGRLTLPSRSDQQLVSIATITAKAEFVLLATPLLTDYVYLQADLLNDSDTILLPGQATMFRNGEFVGKGQLPQVTIGEKFTAGFGIDSQVRVAHELEDKKSRIQGGNRIDTYYYRIALSSYKNTPVELKLLDRLPYTDDTSVKVELEKADPELSKNAEYLRTARKKGILRWDLQLAPNSVGEKATVVRYSFIMEYDKNMQIQPHRSGQ
jgi:uncharacterized protein (TIGR02231 family)